MLLTISTTQSPATDLGYLLYKNPSNVRTVKLSFGNAHVFYPQARDDLCTAALVLEVDPVALVRKKGGGSEAFTLSQYVNDRPYAASSFMSVAISKLFGTAMSGRCEERPDLWSNSEQRRVMFRVSPSLLDSRLLNRLSIITQYHE